jgi:thiamine biosynthesis lipoprotein
VSNAEAIKFGRTAMACRFEVILRGQDPDWMQRAADDALDEVDRIEELISMYDPQSEVSAINRSAAAGPVEVDEEVFDLLLLAGTIWEKTDGAFDPTIGPLVRLWRGWREKGAAPDPAAVESVLQRVGMRHVVFDIQRRTVQFDRPGVEFDVGAFGKGYAVDRAVEILEAYGFGDLLVHAGTSSVAARGKVDDEHGGWPVGLTDPADPQKVIETLTLLNEAIGCSNQQNQNYECEGRKLGHVLDPRTGWPVPADSSIVVTYESATWADALSTALLVLGREGADRVAESSPNARIFCFSGGVESGPMIGLR